MLFKKKKVLAGKNTKEDKPSFVASGAAPGEKKPARFGMLGGAWKKLNSIDRKQVYTWGAVAAVILVALLTLGSVLGSSERDDFSGFETRGYDLANMPFSTDEAEQYLLASKYPDMQGKQFSSLYSPADKAARQAEDAEKAAELDTSASSNASQYVPGRYYGGGAGTASPTQVGSLNTANVAGAKGAGLSGTFGPAGDFSNFRSQEKGGDKFTPQGPGSGDARKALFQAAMGSRAAAGLKNDKLLNAKKAMMGGNIKGSGAFLNDSGAVNLGEAKGLELDTNAPVSSADLSGLDDALQDAAEEAAEEAKEKDQKEWWEEMLIDLAKQAANLALQWGMGQLQDAIAAGQAKRAGEAMKFSEISAAENARVSTEFTQNQTRLQEIDAELKSYQDPARLIREGTGGLNRQDALTRERNALLSQQAELAKSYSNFSSKKITNLSQTEKNMLFEGGNLNGHRGYTVDLKAGTATRDGVQIAHRGSDGDWKTDDSALKQTGERFGMSGVNERAGENVSRKYSAEIKAAGLTAKANFRLGGGKPSDRLREQEAERARREHEEKMAKIRSKSDCEAKNGTWKDEKCS